MIIARRFSLTNFFIATTALGFQVFVLYPWHKQLDDDFKELREESLRILKRRDEAHLAELLEIKELIRRSDARSTSLEVDLKLELPCGRKESHDPGFGRM